MLWAVKHGFKSDGRNEELKEIIEADCVKISRIKKFEISASVSFVNFEKKACKILNYKNH